MTTVAELLQQGRRDEVWKKYCGFLDLNLQEYMDIQERLLMEQIELLSRCELGRKLLRNQVPTSVEEFRSQTPLTTYDDYLPFLLDRNPAPLPRPPAFWARSSGRSSEFGFKWVAYSKEMTRKVGEFIVTSFLLASCSGRGDVQLNIGEYILFTLAPPPYFSGVLAHELQDQLQLIFLPSLAEGDKMDFEQRIETGFRLALKSQLDLFYGLSSLLVAIGERFAEGSGNVKFSLDMLDPRLIFRFIRGLAASKLQHRNLLPKDLWKIKGIVVGGMDTSFYVDAIEALWGKKPLEGYGGTELGGIAMQAWNYKGMTFLPDYNFLEFITEEDFWNSMSEDGYSDKQPRTLLLNELTPGGIYELVITNFHGGVFTRYRTGDLIQIIALRDEELNINTPQMVFYTRADGVIDLAGFTRLTEKSISTAIWEAGVSTNGWTVRKEYDNEKPFLHLYLEPKSDLEVDESRLAIHRKLKDKDPGYADLEGMLGFNPLVVTILPKGAFERYMDFKRANGADLAHIKPPRVNPTDQALAILIK